jgi:hypothetical protein
MFFVATHLTLSRFDSIIRSALDIKVATKDLALNAENNTCGRATCLRGQRLQTSRNGIQKWQYLNAVPMRLQQSIHLITLLVQASERLQEQELQIIRRRGESPRVQEAHNRRRAPLVYKYGLRTHYDGV